MDEQGAREVLHQFGPGPHVVDDVLQIYTITEGASDAPPGLRFGVRESTIGPGRASPTLGWVRWAATLDGARELVPARAGYRLPRDPKDPPVIVEVWL